jgi:hypothetical protein
MANIIATYSSIGGPVPGTFSIQYPDPINVGNITVAIGGQSHICEKGALGATGGSPTQRRGLPRNATDDVIGIWQAACVTR